MSMRNKALEEQVAALYAPGLPYHNFEHAVTVMQTGEGMMSRCRAEGITVDEEIVYYAMLFHDAGYHGDEAGNAFDSKEAYAAHLADAVLSDNKIAAEVVKKVKTAIMSAHCDGKCHSVEDKVVRAVDLDGFAASYSVFKENAIKLKDEYHMLTGHVVPWDVWCEKMLDKIELFLQEELYLTSDYFNENGEFAFHLKARENLKTIIQDDMD